MKQRNLRQNSARKKHPRSPTDIYRDRYDLYTEENWGRVKALAVDAGCFEATY